MVVKIFRYIPIISILLIIFFHSLPAQEKTANPETQSKIESINLRFSRALSLENASKYMEAIFEYKSLLQENPYFF
ncbi:MAG: hypothetical protein DRP54_09210, partial [Spirochaetes bacterium]